MWLKKNNFLFNNLYNTGIIYPAPNNLTNFWNFGIYAFICLIIQIITGIFLSMHYTANIDLAFLSVEHIMRDVNNGWLFRYIHANGASMFFLVVYIHLLRGLYYNSFVFPREMLWISGIIIILLMIITAFLGYVLPWGQMSYWAATVITNLCSAIPYFGDKIVIWLWGGYAIDNVTLLRFYSLHFTFPFIILIFVGFHFLILHEVGSNNPIGINFKNIDFIHFTPYYIIKDLLGIFIFLFYFILIVFFKPNLLNHSDNYINANPMVTPTHIVPEWYFLPFYAILRSIPDKLFGVLVLMFAIIILGLIPFLYKINVITNEFKPLVKFVFWFFFLNVLLLGWIGNEPIEYPYFKIGQLLTILYFLFLLVIFPFSNIIDNAFWTFEKGIYIDFFFIETIKKSISNKIEFFNKRYVRWVFTEVFIEDFKLFFKKYW